MASKKRSTGVGDRCGPQGYENWRLASKGEPAQSAVEIPLYSDTSVSGEVTEGWGPYKVFNTISAAHGPACLPVLVLRASWHLGQISLIGAEETDTSRFHGGSIYDEIASILGLKLGIRLRASSVTRSIYPDLRPERPIAEDPASVPTLPLRNQGRPSNLDNPRHAKVEAAALERYARMRPRDAVALARAARLYQSALWTCDADPSNAWLMLVSAIEVVSVEWRMSTTDGDPTTLLRALKPEWVERLNAAGGEELVGYMASQWVDLLKATDRFLKFMVAHMPGPPERRPPVYKVDWDPAAMKKAMCFIYDKRSEALHGGIPFPTPMCSPPVRVTADSDASNERPIGLASQALGAVYMQADFPMHMHIFAHIVRGAILKWWDTLPDEEAVVGEENA